MLALRDDPERSHDNRTSEAPTAGADSKKEQAIVCAACETSITTARQRIASHGAHEHRFMNPAGITFHIGCFAQAIGCVTVGPASLEYAWFPGFAWRLALCGRCGRQLGWRFRGDSGDGFFGLILDRLHEAELDG
jgi:hypothetical protein